MRRRGMEPVSARHGRARRGRPATAAVVTAVLAVVTVTSMSSAGAAARPRITYLVSLGDSLSVGWQPTPASPVGQRTNQGYADVLYRTLHARQPRLRLVKLGCPGETTGTMMRGGICRYAEGSQLAAAQAFLGAHPGAVSLVTIDIGANDVDSCARGAQIDIGCVTTGFDAIKADLPVILGALRSSGGPRTRIVGMTLYDPFLQQWLLGPAGQSVARASAALAAQLATIFTTVDQAAGAKTADVFGTFATSDFGHPVRVVGHGPLPRNVARICTWTWMCAAPPVGPNIHANTPGYRAIADAFHRVG